MTSHAPITQDEIKTAHERIRHRVVRTPLIRLNVNDAPAEIYLKLENLQPIGSFKLRGALNAMSAIDDAGRDTGVWTASAGNMAQGVAWAAQRLQLKCTVVVPDSAPATKVAAIERYGANIIKVPRAEWADIFRTRRYPGMEGAFLHAFNDRAMMAGNGTIAVEILEDLPDVDAIVAPFGGGGLSCGIGSAVHALKPSVKVYAGEVETAAPLAPSLAAGNPVEIDPEPSFVDGIGIGFVLPEMFRLAEQVLDDALVVRLEEVVAAIRLLAERNHLIAEGAAGAAIAAALSGQAGNGKVVCVVSGGNIDTDNLVKVLQGEIP